MIDYKKKEKDAKKIGFAYQPAEPRAQFDKTFHTKNSEGNYTFHGKYKLVESIEELEKIRDEYYGKIIAVDTETTGLTYFKDYIVGFSLAISSSVEDTAYYVPIRHKIKKEFRSERITKLDNDGNIEYTPAGKVRTHIVKEYTYHDSPYNVKAKQKYLIKKFVPLDNIKNIKKLKIKKLKIKQRFSNVKYELKYGTDKYDKLALDMLYDLMLNAKGCLLHNAEFDLVMLQGEGYDTSKINFFDTQVLTYQIDAEAVGRAHSLKDSEKHYLGRYRPNFEETLGGAENFQYTDPKESYFYAAVDASSTYGIYEVLRIKLYSILDKHEDTLIIDGHKYDTIKKDNKLIKCFVEYYDHTPIYIDKQRAIEYKKKVTHDLISLRTEIYDFFKRGIFNLSTSSKEFKSAMIDKNIVTGGITEKGNASYGKDGLKEFGRNLKNLELYIKREKDIIYSNSLIDIRSNMLSFNLVKIIDAFGKDYFYGKYIGNNSYRIFDKDKKELSKKELIESLKVMLEKEKEKFGILKKIQENSSLNKAVNSYIEKLTQVDSCRMRYKLFSTKSGRLASGNGSKSDKKIKNRYYIDLNAQNLSKPKSCFYKAYKGEKEGNILGWYFEQISDEYAKEHLEDEYIVEGYSPEYNIRDCIIAPEGKIIFSKDYEAQEAKLLALLSQDSVMIENFLNGIDPHTATAYGIWGKENYNKEKRKIAKTVNFAVNYGGGYGTISDSAEIPLDEAKEILNLYEKTFCEAVQWKKNQIDKVFNKENKEYTEGVVYNLFGRPRRLGSFVKVAKRNLEEDDSVEMYRKCIGFIKSAERRVASHEIQGFAGDLCRLVLIKLYDKYFKNKNEDVDFLNAVHDEVNFYITNDKEKIMQYNREIEDLMEFKSSGWQFNITSPSLDLGYRWGSVFNFHWTDSSRVELIPKRLK